MRAMRATFSVFTVLLLGVAASASAQQTVTSPEQQFGHEIGADYVLPNYTDLYEYWQKLARESDRMTVEDIGRICYQSERSYEYPPCFRSARNKGGILRKGGGGIQTIVPTDQCFSKGSILRFRLVRGARGNGKCC